MEQQQYTLPGVMQFLRQEWQHKEQTRIEWELEKAELQSRVNKLESDKTELQRELDNVKRSLDILINEHKYKKINISEPKDIEEQESHLLNDAGDRKSANLEFEVTKATTDNLVTTINHSRKYLKQCIADIRHVLKQSGSINGDSDVIITPQPDKEISKCFTLANFKGSPLTVAMLPDGRITAGTDQGDLLIWKSQDDSNLTAFGARFGTSKESVNCLRYSSSTDQILVGTGNEIHVYSTADEPQFVTSVKVGDLPVVYLTVAPNGNLVSSVQSDGRVTVWSMPKDQSLQLMCEPANGVRASEFVEIDGDLNLVLTRSSEPSSQPSTELGEGSLILADPISGEFLKRIFFTFTAGITSMAVTHDTIILGTDSGDLRVIGLNRGDTLAEVVSAHRGEITSLTAVSDDSLLSTSIDGRVSLWSLPTLMWKGRLFCHDSGYGALSSAHWDGNIVIGGGDGIIRVYYD